MENEANTDLCLHLSGSSPCGAFGQCIDNECTCSGGFQQGFEMAVYFLPSEEISTRGLCQKNTTLEIFLYSLVIVLVTIILMVQVCRLSRKSQYKRLTPLLIGLLIMIITALYKLIVLVISEVGANPDLIEETGGLGIDVLYSALVGGVYSSGFISSLIYYERFVLFLVARLHVVSKKAGGRVRLLRKQKYYCIAYDLSYLLLFIISAVLVQPRNEENDESNRNAGLTIIRLAFAMIGLRAGYTIFLTEYLLSEFISDVKLLLLSEVQRGLTASDASRNVSITTRKESIVSLRSTSHKKKMTSEKLLKLLNNIRATRRMLNTVVSFLLVLSVLPSFWSYMLYQMQYLFPASMLVWTFCNFWMTLLNKSKKKEQQRLSNRKEPAE